MTEENIETTRYLLSDSEKARIFSMEIPGRKYPNNINKISKNNEGYEIKYPLPNICYIILWLQCLIYVTVELKCF